MKKIRFAALVLFLFNHSFSQEAKPFIDIDGIRDTIQFIMKEEKIAGLMLGIATRDSVLFNGGFGFADIESERPVNEKSLFRLGSISKMFVAGSILKLVQEGKINLEDELKKIAPDVPFKNKWESTDPVRIINLLEHTTGFDDIKLNRMYTLNAKDLKGRDVMLFYKGSMISRWKPGERFSYSNPNYTILGYVIEKITGMPYDQYISNTFFRPLGMTGSNFNLSRGNSDDVSEYALFGRKLSKIPSIKSVAGAPGALWSSSADMVHFIRFFLNNGNGILNQEMIEKMETARTPIVNKDGVSFGYALGIENNNYPLAKFPMFGHNGLTGSCFSSFRYNRQLGIGFVLSSNSNYSGRKLEEFLVRKLQENFPAPSVYTEPLDVEAVKPFLGYYQWQNPRHVISGFADELQTAPRLLVKDKKLFFKPLIGTPQPLVQMGKGIYSFENCTVPLINLQQSGHGKQVMRLGGLYFVRQNSAVAIGYRLAVVAALIITVTIFIWLPFVIIRIIQTKSGWDAMWISLIIALGVAGLIGAVISLLHVQTYTYKLFELSTVNSRSLTIFSGTVLFGIAVVCALGYRLFIFRKSYPGLYKWYYSLVCLSLLFLGSILLVNGWIGLRVWAM